MARQWIHEKGLHRWRGQTILAEVAEEYAGLRRLATKDDGVGDWARRRLDALAEAGVLEEPLDEVAAAAVR